MIHADVIAITVENMEVSPCDLSTGDRTAYGMLSNRDREEGGERS